MRRTLPSLRCLTVVGLFLAAPLNALSIPHSIARLRTLDKVTGHVSTQDLPVGSSQKFGTLEIIVRCCDQTPEEELPEAAAFLEISEKKDGKSTPSLIFSNFMFASNPGISALEHPVYDVWVEACYSP